VAHPARPPSLDQPQAEDALRAEAKPKQEQLEDLLSEARRLGFLGPPPISEQLQRSLAFAELAGTSPRLAIDLGSGGGLPALVLASTWPASRWVLLESSQRRANWLAKAVAALGIAPRCQVLCMRAEEAGIGAFRHSADLVTARSFAPPGPTAECAAPLLRLGGRLLVSCPPGTGKERWPPEALRELGLVLEEVRSVPTPVGPATIARLSCQVLCGTPYPRRAAFKRPLF
jgi:16S rRNA (guanine527-N7)-methyltransferase